LLFPRKVLKSSNRFCGESASFEANIFITVPSGLVSSMAQCGEEEGEGEGEGEGFKTNGGACSCLFNFNSTNEGCSWGGTG
jgi:hypothetical protein